MSAATQAMQIQSKILLGGNQTWAVANANTNGNPFGGTINAGVSEDLLFNSQATNTAMNLGGFTLGTSGAGTIVITNGYTLSNGTLNFGNTNTWIQSGSSRATTLLNTLAVNVGTNANLRLRANSGGVSSASAIGVSGAGAKLQLEINNNGVTMAQSGALTFGTGTTFENMLSSSGAMTIGAIATSGSVAWNVNGGGSSGVGHANGIAVSGNLTGNGTITYANTATASNGQVRLSGDNSGFAGTMNINGGSGNRSLRLTSASAGSSSATWTPAAGNLLEVDGVAVNLGTLNGAGTVTNSHATNAAGITVGAGSFSGAITNGTPVNGMALTKTGSGTLTLSGANSYSGLTNIQGGTLATTTAHTGGGAVTVGDTAIFSVSQLSAGVTFNTSNLTLGSAGGSTLALNPAASPTAALVTATSFTVNGNNTIRVTGLPVSGTKLVDYSGSIGGSGFAGLSLALPFRISGTLDNNTVNTSVDLIDVQVETPKWSGAANSTWDITSDSTGNSGATANWLTSATLGSTRYVEAGVGQIDSVIFDDSASGSTNVSLNTSVTPVSVTVNNSSQSYSITGTGAINGSGGITKSGTASLTLATANGFSGGVQLNGGTLNVNHNTALGTGTLTIAGGTLDNTSGSARTASNAQGWNGDFTFIGSNDLTLGAAAMNASRQVTVNAGTLTVGGISGSGFGLTKAGAGTLAVGASSYSGATVVNGGSLKATSATSFNATSSITLANSAGVALDLNGINQTIATISGGGAAGGDLLLNGAVLTTGTASNNTFAGDLVGTGGLTKQGSGILTLSGEKSGYTGTTNITGGTLDLNTINGSFGAAVTVTAGAANNSIIVGSGLFVQGNGTLNTGISGGGAGFGARGGNLTVNVGGAGAMINRNSAGNAGLGQMIFGSATSDSRVIVQNEVGINNNGGTRDITVNIGTGTASAEIAGIISSGVAGGISGIVKLGAGDLVLSNANTYLGTTTISAGRIVLGHAQALQFSALSTASSGKVTATGFATPTLGGLTGSTDLATVIDTGYSGITTLTLNPQGSQSQIYSGAIANGASGMNLVKSGTGTQTLNGVNTYTGSTTVATGILALGLNGTISDDLLLGTATPSVGTLDITAKASFSQVDVSGNGTLNIGAGKDVTVTGSLAPGFSPGTLNVTGNLVLTASTSTSIELAGNGGVEGVDSDDINVSGTLIFDGTLSILSYGGYDLTQNATYNLFDAASFSGDFDGVTVGGNALGFDADLWSGTFGATTYSFSETTGVLTVIPEPSAALLGGLGMLVLLRRRRGDG
jgi:autotransporter-associated beta strand protein